MGHNIGEIITGNELIPNLNTLLESLSVGFENPKSLSLDVFLISMHVTREYFLIIGFSIAEGEGTLAEAS